MKLLILASIPGALVFAGLLVLASFGGLTP